MKKIVFAAAASLCGLASVAQAGGCDSPFCQGSSRGHGGFFGGKPMPAFQAAPWYLYWPYNQHFMTPSPMQGAYSAPPGSGYGGMANPYFPGGYGYGAPPAAAYSPPAGGYAPTPPAPMPPVVPQPSGVTPAVTPGVSIPAVPGTIRTVSRR